MASPTICGNCGSALPGPAATCSRCGSTPAGSRGFVVRRKSPLAAAALALVPGLGHLYIGQPLKGAFFLFACGGLEFFGFDLDLTAIGAAAGVPMGLGGVGLYAYQVYDAYQQARRLNAEAPAY